jgi:hypothetical protein
MVAHLNTFESNCNLMLTCFWEALDQLSSLQREKPATSQFWNILSASLPFRPARRQYPFSPRDRP